MVCWKPMMKQLVAFMVLLLLLTTISPVVAASSSSIDFLRKSSNSDPHAANTDGVDQDSCLLIELYKPDNDKCIGTPEKITYTPTYSEPGSPCGENNNCAVTDRPSRHAIVSFMPPNTTIAFLSLLNHDPVLFFTSSSFLCCSEEPRRFGICQRVQGYVL